uniref:Uncharacterized protein n=1 Tax=Knipowitschia caucasica TaxID=637954 RepID=A0AAV2IS24_KNICA
MSHDTSVNEGSAVRASPVKALTVNSARAPPTPKEPTQHDRATPTQDIETTPIHDTEATPTEHLKATPTEHLKATPTEHLKATPTEREDEESGDRTISELVYSPCASLMSTPVDEGAEFLFTAFQSPAPLLRQLHADALLEARMTEASSRDPAREASSREQTAESGRSLDERVQLTDSSEGGGLSRSCAWSVVRLVAVVTGLLLVTVTTLLLLLESDIDVTFLREIRATPEFQQFHHEFYCPLRRWVLCSLWG